MNATIPKLSNGEDKILSILVQAGIDFEREKKFKDLKHGWLRYDFYVPSRNTLIEFNGIQHYIQVPHFQKTRNDFLHYQENDRRKIAYALAHDIDIYCIPFWEEDKLVDLESLLKPEYKAATKWKNDDDYYIFKKNVEPK